MNLKFKRKTIKSPPPGERTGGTSSKRAAWHLRLVERREHEDRNIHPKREGNGDGLRDTGGADTPLGRPDRTEG